MQLRPPRMPALSNEATATSWPNSVWRAGRCWRGEEGWWGFVNSLALKKIKLRRCIVCCFVFLHSLIHCYYTVMYPLDHYPPCKILCFTITARQSTCVGSWFPATTTSSVTASAGRSSTMTSRCATTPTSGVAASGSMTRWLVSWITNGFQHFSWPVFFLIVWHKGWKRSLNWLEDFDIIF